MYLNIHGYFLYKKYIYNNFTNYHIRMVHPLLHKKVNQQFLIFDSKFSLMGDQIGKINSVRARDDLVTKDHKCVCVCVRARARERVRVIRLSQSTSRSLDILSVGFVLSEIK